MKSTCCDYAVDPTMPHNRDKACYECLKCDCKCGVYIEVMDVKTKEDQEELDHINELINGQL